MPSPVWRSEGYFYDVQVCRFWCILTATNSLVLTDDSVYLEGEGLPIISHRFCANPLGGLAPEHCRNILQVDINATKIL